MTDTQQVEAESAAEAAVDLEVVALRVEAALLTSDRAIAGAKLAEALGVSGTKLIQDAIESLNEIYEQTGRSFRIEKVAGGWQMMTLAEYADVLSSLHKTRAAAKITPAVLETLAIVAYKQPIMRAAVETIRGVACGEILRSLMDRHLVKIVGRAEELGRPMLYGTTKQFLETFGLGTLKDLPKVEELTPPPEVPPEVSPEQSSSPEFPPEVFPPQASSLTPQGSQPSTEMSS